jgi:hypothetical protein
LVLQEGVVGCVTLRCSRTAWSWVRRLFLDERSHGPPMDIVRSSVIPFGGMSRIVLSLCCCCNDSPSEMSSFIPGGIKLREDLVIQEYGGE